jgi:hypothetical protein
MPDLNDHLPLPRSTYEWLGRVGALIHASGEVIDIAEFNTYASSLNTPVMHFSSAQNLRVVIYRALAKAELNAPAAVQGMFLPAGSAFDAMAAVAKVLGEAGPDVLIVDPYLDEKVLTDFAVVAPEAVPLRLLADAEAVKPSLSPAATRWITQYGSKRPLTVKLAPARTLHDRLIDVDRTTVWVLTQSFNALATRAPASIVRVDDQTAKLKIGAYEAIWANAALV